MNQKNETKTLRDVTRWKRVPVRFYRCCMIAAWISSDLGTSEEHSAVYCLQAPRQILRRYDLHFFQLHETPAGHWFIKWG